ncbi:MAG: ADP-forming succinate--CoA ligase subunit beta [Rickettsiales endosymbiont of Dermacentor nuttalli]
MNIHEYQAKQILAKYQVPVPRGKEAFTAEEAKTIAKSLKSSVTVVKAQIHAGGRGKAGGVKLVKSPEEAFEQAQNLLGKVLVTHQTGPEGREVKCLYIEEGSDIAKEYYVGVVVDRNTSTVTFMVSQEGGVEIEEVTAKSPEKLIKQVIDPAIGMQPFYGRKMAYALGLSGDLVKKFTVLVTNLYKVFTEMDASQLEINPLVITKTDEIIALDAKINFDDNALFRHPDIVAMCDENEEDPLERKASAAELSYVKMSGNIGCMVNGAGLAMATMDIIKLYGAEPANFLDVGGGADKQRVIKAFKIILSDSNVKAILINIFGGIMRCDIIAEGVVAAAKEIGLSVPLVVRLAGTNVELGKKILDNSGLKVIAADDLADAADKIVKAI